MNTLHGLYRCESCGNTRWIKLPTWEKSHEVTVPPCCNRRMEFAWQWLQNWTMLDEAVI